MAAINATPKPTKSAETDLLTNEEKPCRLLLWNDDVNTFDWVIKTLVEVCKHQKEQAEQCAYLVHYNGKCIVKEGSFDTLRPMCEAIINRGINATLEDVG